MRRILLIARRDFLAAVKSKPFLFGLILAPLLFGSGFIGLAVLKAKPDIAPRHVAILDRTGTAAEAIVDAAAAKSAAQMYDKLTHKQVEPAWSFEIVAPVLDADAQRLALSERVRRREIYAFLEIGALALHPPTADAAKTPPEARVDYYSNAGGIDLSQSWLSGPINDGLRRARLAALGLAPARFADVLAPATIQTMSLLSRDPQTGRIQPAHKRSEFEMAVPFVLMIMLAMMAIMSSSPLLGAVADDKQQRVFEMLLGSASAFELMMGKVLAAIALTLTSSTLYIGVGLLVLSNMAMLGLAPLGLLPWFFIYLVADILVLSSLGIAVGSACSSPSDAQHLAIVVIGPTIIPLMLLAPMMQAPNGTLAVVMSLVPPFTPLVMLMRQALPGGVPAWQPWAGLAGVVAWTLLATWAAARIFRVGILVQGKTPKVADLARWAIHG